MRHLIKAVTESGYDCVVANYRSVTGLPMKVPKLPRIGDSTDIKCIVEYLHKVHCDNG